jgi:hypothetical protein
VQPRLDDHGELEARENGVSGERGQDPVVARGVVRNQLVGRRHA